MRTQLKAAVVIATMSLIGLGCLLFSGSVREGRVSLVFQRYSDLDPYVGDVAFLWLTNASNRSYLLSMTGGSNTCVEDTDFGRHRESWMINCEFKDQTSNGWTSWVQMPSPFSGSNRYVTLAPRSGMVVRVPLTADGQHRRVAALYQSSDNTLAYWFTAIGVQLSRMLPQFARPQLLNPQPVLRRAWCSRELSYPADH